MDPVDSEPELSPIAHRGPLALALGIFGLVVGFGSLLVCQPFGVVPLIASVAAVYLGAVGANKVKDPVLFISGLIIGLIGGMVSLLSVAYSVLVTLFLVLYAAVVAVFLVLNP